MAGETHTIKLGLPKGSLEEATIALLGKAGWRVNVSERSYYPRVDDPEISAILIRAQEMSRYVEEGVLDAGITGMDWTIENGSDVHEIARLRYAKRGRGTARWVLAVAEDSDIRCIEDLEGKRIATELVSSTKRWLKEKGVAAHVEFSWGATEVKVPDLVDAIVELTETGNSLRANNLRIVETLLESDVVFIANKKTWKDDWKRQKLENIAILLQGAIDAEKKVGLKLNCSEKNLSSVLALLPSLHAPTVSHLMEESWRAVEVVIDEHVVRELIPRLRRAGAEGIIEYPLNKVIE
jgi:ATP phosphoribosyltransferase